MSSTAKKSLKRWHRYQLKKEPARVVSGGHPWVFRGQLSSAAAIFAEGQPLKLVGPDNAVVGYGLFQEQGAIAIRVLQVGPEPPEPGWLHRRCRDALHKRKELRRETDGFRAVNGENDGIPGVTLDVFGKIGVLQTYTRGVDGLGRLAARYLARELGLEGMLYKPPRRRAGASSPPRVLMGEVPDVVRFREGPLELAADPWRGQKSGIFLDLRGLRRWLWSQDLSGKSVLNLFSYTGALGVAARGARVIHVDDSASALEFGRLHHGQEGLQADLFGDWAGVPEGPFDLVLVDPPLMTSRTQDVPQALKAYRKLYRRALTRLAPGGRLVACCCTSRIAAPALKQTLAEALKLPLRHELPPEVDHRPTFPEADYLNVLIYG